MKKIHKINWKKGNGELLSLSVIAVIICILIIFIASFIQLSTSLNDITKITNVAARGAAICSSMEEAKEQVQNIIDNSLISSKNSNLSNVRAEIGYAGNTENWTGGGFIVITVKANIKTIEPYFTSGTREKRVLVSIEGMNMNGSTIIIPEQYGNGGYTITKYDQMFWTPGTMQKNIFDYWDKIGRPWNDHIASINGYYLIACTPKFGNAGDVVVFELEDGTRINCIVADSKRVTSNEGSNEWGHCGGQNIIEFEAEGSYYDTHGNPGTYRWKPEWYGKRVCKGINLGKYSAFK